jgi:predicted DNA-binding ribbon-helix-helix protein
MASLEQTRKFLDELEKLPENTKLCIARLLSEINEVALIHIGGCPWREPHQQLLESMPALRVLAPSIHIVEHKREGKVVMYGLRWTYHQFAMPLCPEITLLWNEIQKKVASQSSGVNWTVMI